MLYHWLYPFSDQISALNIFRYITVRSFLGFILGIIISVYLGKKFILIVQKIQFGQSVREDGPQTHLKKTGTPTGGGLFIVGSIIITLLFVGNFSALPFLFVLAMLILYGILGFWDDYLKVVKKNSKGVSGRAKLIYQFAVAIIVSVLLLYFEVIDSSLYLPFFKGEVINLGWGYVAFSSLVIVGSSNAVNLTDGLDGLAGGPIITSSSSLGFLSYIAGHSELAAYLFMPYVANSGEMMVLVAALIGATMGFLWYNAHPAQVFMGDVGSLSIGGVLGTIAVISKNEILFVLIGGTFVLEALSVIIQVCSYKLRKKRVFRMAPLHHHFELKGWAESQVVMRFWIISAVFAILAMATIKVR